MPRIDNKVLQGLSGPEIIHSERYVEGDQLKVSVLQERDTFDEFNDGCYTAIETRWATNHFGGEFPITQEEYRRYVLTAVISRVMRVRNERFHIRCDDVWALPAITAAVIAGIGRVILEAPVVTIMPSIDRDLISEAMTYDEWSATGRKFRAMESDPSMKLLLAHAIAGEKDGDEALMTLIPVTDEAGRLLELRQKYEIHPISAAAFLILSLSPEGLGTEALPAHPLLRSPHYIRIAGVKAFLHRFYDSVA